MKETFFEIVFSDMYGEWIAWLTPEKYEMLDSTSSFDKIRQNATFMINMDTTGAICVNAESTLYKMIVRLSEATIERTNLKKYNKFSIWLDVNQAIDCLKIIRPPFDGTMGERITIHNMVIYVDAGPKSGRTTYITQKIADNKDTYGLLCASPDMDTSLIFNFDVVFIEGLPSSTVVKNLTVTYPNKIFVIII